MKKFFSLVVFFLLGCGYSFVLERGKSIWLDEVRSKSSAFPGIEADLTSALIRAFNSRGIEVVRKCPYIRVYFLGLSTRNYYYTAEGRISDIDGYARYEVTMEKCDGSKVKNRFSVPLHYRYYTSPFATESSRRRAVIGSVDTLVERIVEFMNEINGSP